MDSLHGRLKSFSPLVKDCLYSQAESHADYTKEPAAILMVVVGVVRV